MSAQEAQNFWNELRLSRGPSSKSWKRSLALPDIYEALLLVDVYGGGSIPKGDLMKTLGPWKRLVAPLSKRLDPVAAGWPACIRDIVATTLLVKAADKLTLLRARIVPGNPKFYWGPLGEPKRYLMPGVAWEDPIQSSASGSTLHVSPWLSLLWDDDWTEPLHDCLEVTDCDKLNLVCQAWSD